MNPAEDYILKQPEPFKTILLHLQVLIETFVTDIELKYKYKIPFYYLNGKPFCYLNVSPKGYVDVGFWKANQIDIHLDHLVTDGRKIMKSLRYYKPEDIKDPIVIDILKDLKVLYS